MQARPTTLALGEVAELLLTASVELGSIIVYNAHASDVAYLKVWSLVTPASTATAPLVFPCPAGYTSIPVFAHVPGPSYWAATGAADTNAEPPADLVVTATYAP
jgi:hypothetical protein